MLAIIGCDLGWGGVGGREGSRAMLRKNLVFEPSDFHGAMIH